VFTETSFIVRRFFAYLDRQDTALAVPNSVAEKLFCEYIWL
jgi:hypothetical protein